MSTAVCAAIAIVVGSLSYLYLGRDLLLAGWTAFVWFVMLRTGVALAQMRTALHRRGGIFGGALTGLIAGAALLGVSPFLPVEPKVRAALQLLVLGTGFAAASLGAYLVLRPSRPLDERRPHEHRLYAEQSFQSDERDRSR